MEKPVKIHELNNVIMQVQSKEGMGEESKKRKKATRTMSKFAVNDVVKQVN